VLTGNIDRIPMPDAETFFRDYVFKRRPVVITNMFEGEPLRELGTLDAALAEFSSMKLLIQPEYTEGMANPNAPRPQVMSLGEYCDHIRAGNSAKLVCTEIETPARVMTQFSLPSVCTWSQGPSDEVLNFPKKYGDNDLGLYTFIANAGNKAHLHYDGDHRQVLLYQVFGKKEVILFDPHSGVDITPLPGSNNFLRAELDRLNDSDKAEFIERHGGYHTVIGPGEAIYMPMLIWHHLNYIDDAMSINFRFGRNPVGRFLCVDNFHRDYYLQNFGALLADQIECNGKYREAIAAITDEYVKPSAGVREKMSALRRLLRQICVEHCEIARVEEYYPLQKEEENLDIILRDLQVKGRFIYEHPDSPTIRSTRPQGSVGETQLRLIQETAGKCGYSSDVLNRVVMNRTGKVRINAMTKVEATNLLQYMKSPSGVL